MVLQKPLLIKPQFIKVQVFIYRVFLFLTFFRFFIHLQRLIHQFRAESFNFRFCQMRLALTNNNYFCSRIFQITMIQQILGKPQFGMLPIK